MSESESDDVQQRFEMRAAIYVRSEMLPLTWRHIISDQQRGIAFSVQMRDDEALELYAAPTKLRSSDETVWRCVARFEDFHGIWLLAPVDDSVQTQPAMVIRLNEWLYLYVDESGIKPFQTLIDGEIESMAYFTNERGHVHLLARAGEYGFTLSECWRVRASDVSTGMTALNSDDYYEICDTQEELLVYCFDMAADKNSGPDVDITRPPRRGDIELRTTSGYVTGSAKRFVEQPPRTPALDGEHDADFE